MSAPPTGLLLAQPYPTALRDVDEAMPLRIRSASSSSLLIACFNYALAEIDADADALGSLEAVDAPQSILVNCYGTQQDLVASLRASSAVALDPEHDANYDRDHDAEHASRPDDAAGDGGEQRARGRSNAADAFFTAAHSAACRKMWYRFAAARLEVVHVTTLAELRGVLYLLQHAHSPAGAQDERVQTERAEVPVTQGFDAELAPSSQPDRIARSRRSSPEDEQQNHKKSRRPLLAIAGIDRLHASAGEYTAQGLGRSLAALRELASQYAVIVHEGGDASEVPLLNSSARLPRAQQTALHDRRTTIDEVYEKHGIGCTWTPDDTGLRSGVWRTSSSPSSASSDNSKRSGYKVSWNQDPSGECRDVRLDRL